MNKIKIYIYPIPSTQQDDKESNNPYILNFCRSVKSSYNILNFGRPSKFESLDLIRYFSAKIFFFNWIEDLSYRRYGKCRIFFFIPLLFALWFCNKKIIWTLHNKRSHDINSNWRMFMEFLMVHISNKIITHSKAGINFIYNKYPKCYSKVSYYCHPIVPIKVPQYKEQTIKFDFLIWGSITPYKGVIDFLKYLHYKKLKCKICIIGKCSKQEYEDELNSYLSREIIHINKFCTLDQILLFAQQSKFILFTYKIESILSSGSLMDAIAMKTPIIGPKTGAFLDMEELGLVFTYNSFDDIFKNSIENKKNKEYIKKCVSFINENNWSNFGKAIVSEIKDL